MSKKLLLLLFLFLSSNINAQPPAVPPPLYGCDDNNDGIAVFDLNDVIPFLIGSMDPATTDFTFYEDLTDAQAGTNAIVSPNNYTNIEQGQFIHIRIIDNSNGQIYFSTISLIPNYVNAGTDGSVTVCETSTTPINLFSLISGENGAGIWSRIAGAGGTFNAAAGTYTPAPGATTSIFMYTFDANQPCPGGSSNAVVNIVPQPNAGIDGSLTACDSSTAAIDLFSLITGEQAGGTWTTTSGTGGTFNAAAGTYIPAPGATAHTFTYTISGIAPCVNDSSVAAVFLTDCSVCETTPPSLLFADGVTFNTATIDWTQTGTNRPISWEIVILPAGSPAPTGGNGISFFASTTNFTITGLSPGTTYDIYVRSVCPSSSSDWTAPLTITTTVAPPVCGGNFVDGGGISGNYSNNTNSTTTICGTAPGDVVNVTFTSFNTEANFDAMYVYDGVVATPFTLLPSANAAGNVPGGMPGGYWGNSIPGPFTSTADNGCLTFVFRSDGTNTLPGWVANVNCSPALQCSAPTALTVNSITSTTANISWSFTSNVTVFEVLILPQGAPSPTFNSGGNPTQSNSYLVNGLSPNTCYDVYVRAVCAFNSEWSSPVSFCMFNCENNASCAESLNLIAFVDSNINGIKDPGEINFNEGNFVYQINDSGDILYGTSSNGNYFIFDSNPLNSYDIQFGVNANLSAYYSSSVTHSNITIATGSGTNTLYFPIVNTQPYVDARVIINANGQPRPGFTYTNTIYYQNRGMQMIPNGTLTFTKSSNVTIQSISPLGTTPTLNGFTYDFTNLAPFETRTIYVSFLVPTLPTVALGDLVTSEASIQISNDADTSNNSTAVNQIIVGSYDPNDKMESHGGKIVHGNFTSNDYLYYTIQFENTGSANAEFIRIEDTLDNQLDETTFEMVSASHTVNTKREDNQLTWHFYNIDLPPTLSNPSESHGFVQFRIKPKAGYAIGDVIPNTGYIYFDYNPAIVTNTFDTEFVQALGNSSFDAHSISLAPNPASRMVTITNNNNFEKIASVGIYDLTGKKIYSLESNSLANISIDVSHFAKGLYLVELVSENNSKVAKKLILK